jgi:hypothetical protein
MVNFTLLYHYLACDTKSFTKCIKNYFHEHSFSTLDEFFMHKLDRYFDCKINIIV